MEVFAFFAFIGGVLYWFLEDLRINQQIPDDVQMKADSVDEPEIIAQVKSPKTALQVPENAQVKVHQVEALFKALVKAENPPQFVAFVFTPPGSLASEGALSIQFSLEAGKPGFDWVSFDDRNKMDEQRFMNYASKKGYSMRVSYEKDGDRILRVENGDLAALCSGVMTEMYGLSPMTLVDLVT